MNSDPHLIVAAAEAFLRLDAASVIVREDPGHHRDTDLYHYRGHLDDPKTEAGFRKARLPTPVLALLQT